MALTLLLLAQIVVAAADGPDLSEVERAVGKCDSGAMTKIFGKEPERRRAAMIAVFAEQQAIVAARRSLALRRFETMSKPAAPAPPEAALDGAVSLVANFDLEKQSLADRQQALDDARMLGDMRDKALDMMRQHYLTTCNARLTSAAQ